MNLHRHYTQCLLHQSFLHLDQMLPEIRKKAESLYEHLNSHGVEVLFDDRDDVMAGEKFADSDLIGLPYRVVVSKRTEDKFEMKKRNEAKTSFVSLEELLLLCKKSDIL